MWIEAGMWGGFGGSATRVDPIHPDDVSRPAKKKKQVKFTFFFYSSFPTPLDPVGIKRPPLRGKKRFS